MIDKQRQFPVFVLWAVLFFSLILLAAGEAGAGEEPVTILSENRKLHILENGQTSDVYLITALSPFQLDVKGPGRLTLSLIKNYDPADPADAGKPATFTILKDNAVEETLTHTAPQVKGRIYKHAPGFLPGKSRDWSRGVPDEKWTIGVIISPDATKGGAIGYRFEPPQEKEDIELIPLVPLVPLVPPKDRPAQPPEESRAEEEKAPAEEQPEKGPPEEPEADEEKPEEGEASGEAAEEPTAEEVGEEPEAEEAPKKPLWFMIEPRLGLNLAIQPLEVSGKGKSTQVDTMFAAGLGARYVLPFLNERFRVGLGLDWHQYGYTQTIETPQDYQGVPAPPYTAKINVDLATIPIMAEADVFILTDGIFRPFGGFGIGVAWVSMDYAGEMWLAAENRYINIDAQERTWTYAVAFWLGCQFNVWYGGPFVKARYLLSKKNYNINVPNPKFKNIKLDNAEHGGLSFLGGYQFEY